VTGRAIDPGGGLISRIGVKTAFGRSGFTAAFAFAGAVHSVEGDIHGVTGAAPCEPASNTFSKALARCYIAFHPNQLMHVMVGLGDAGGAQSGADLSQGIRSVARREDRPAAFYRI